MEENTIQQPSSLPLPKSSFFNKIYNYKFTILIIILIIMLAVGYYYRKNRKVTIPGTTKTGNHHEFVVLDINNQAYKISGTPVQIQVDHQVYKPPQQLKKKNVEYEVSSENDNIAQHNLTNSEIKEITDKLNIKN
jgi:PDZ domain-containing secreted protein